jgi:ferredoxin-like protein FixX
VGAPRVKAAAAELVTALREARTCLAAARGALKWHYPRGGLGVQFRGG